MIFRHKSCLSSYSKHQIIQDISPSEHELLYFKPLILGPSLTKHRVSATFDAVTEAPHCYKFEMVHISVLVGIGYLSKHFSLSEANIRKVFFIMQIMVQGVWWGGSLLYKGTQLLLARHSTTPRGLREQTGSLFIQPTDERKETAWRIE